MPWITQSSVYSHTRKEFIDLHQKKPTIVRSGAKACALNYVFTEGFSEGATVVFVLYHGFSKLTWKGKLKNVDPQMGFEVESTASIFKLFRSYCVFGEFENQLLVRESFEFEAENPGLNIALQQTAVQHELDQRRGMARTTEAMRIIGQESA